MTIQEMKQKKKELGYTNEMVSALSGVPLGTVQKVFAGATPHPRYETLQALEKAFKDEKYYSKSMGEEKVQYNADRVSEAVTSYQVKKQGEYTLREYEAIPDVAFLGGHSLNELIAAELFATGYALAKAGKPNKTIFLPEVNAFTIGQLLYFFEMATAYAGEVLDINAFDQPGVEGGKQATYALLGKPGFETKKQEMDAAPKGHAAYELV